MVEEAFIKFLGDISGIPKKNTKTKKYENVMIGVVTVNKFTIKNDLKDIQNKFPSYWNKKGNQLTDNQLEKIIDYLNKKNMKMITVHFYKSDWDKYRKKYINEANFEEKVMSILYFYALKFSARSKYRYNALLDNDTNFGIIQCTKICNRLLREQHLNIEISFGYREVHEELRLPDWVAQARKKIAIKKLNKYKNFYILENKMPKMYLLKTFKSIKW